MRNPNAQHINFEFMKGIIPDNYLWLASNIDMCCERKGQFLFAEWKRIYEDLKDTKKDLIWKVTKISEGAVNSEVTIELPDGAEVVSSITRAAAENLGLAVGKEAYAVIKASNVLIAID